MTKYKAVEESNKLAAKQVAALRELLAQPQRTPVDEICEDLARLANRALTEFKISEYDSILRAAASHMAKAHAEMRRYERLKRKP
jgi:hypothetical protein